MIPVYCICLTADRPQQTARAIRSFLAQTYENKWLLIFDTSKRSKMPEGEGNLGERVIHMKADAQPGDTIGKLRNLANSFAPEGSLLCHWDSDDWSAPERLEDQVELLLHSQCDAFGANSMHFWDSVAGESWCYIHGGAGFALGTSLMYHRASWVSNPFPEKTDYPMGAGEDTAWVRGVRCCSVPCWGNFSGPFEPVMIAELHLKNTSSRRQFEKALAQGSTDWVRTPELDEFCHERMKL